jgi:hypothetical protein
MLRIWRVAVILNKSRGHPTRGVPPAWGLGTVLTTPHCKKSSISWHVTQGLGLGRTSWADSLASQEGLYSVKLAGFLVSVK